MLRINRNPSSDSALAADPTVDNFKNLQIFYPDHPTVRWQSVVLGKMISATDLKGSLDVCVIGRGAGALAVMTELDEIARKNANLTVNVRNSYYDTEVEQAGDPQVTYNSKWGRIFAAKPGKNYQEIGCMRFPSIALLTWHYISKAYPDQGSSPLSRFPNPGRVPTQFLYRDMNVIFEVGPAGLEAIKDMNDADQLENFQTMEAVRIGVISYMLNEVVDKNKHNVSYFADILVGVPIGDSPKPPTILHMSDAQVQEVWRQWNAFIAQFDVPLISIVQKAIDKLIEDKKIHTTATRDRAYFIELFGRYGFGTGGFRPLNSIAFNEIARLLIWNYSDEYLFPGNTGDSASANAEFASRLCDGLTSIKLTSAVEKALFIGRRKSDSRLVVVRYNKKSGQIEESVHDHVVLATSHHAAQIILEPFAGMQKDECLQEGSELRFEVNGATRTYRTTTDLQHPFDLLRGGSGDLYAGLKNLHMMRSTKYFTDVATSEFNSHTPTSPDQKKRVQMVISDTDLAASYCLDGQDNTTSILVSYTWGDESTNEAVRLRGLSSHAGSAADATLRWKHAQATNRFAQPSSGNAIAGFWLSKLLGEAKQLSGYMYDWSADQDSRGAFKLDGVSETAFSTALYDHYRTSVLSAEAKQQDRQRMFVAGDSFSHHGGWLEGAFMTAITAVAGLMRSAFDASIFSDEGKRLFLTP